MFFPQRLRREHRADHHLAASRTFNLQNDERIDFSYLKGPSLWTFVLLQLTFEKLRLRQTKAFASVAVDLGGELGSI